MNCRNLKVTCLILFFITAIFSSGCKTPPTNPHTVNVNLDVCVKDMNCTQKLLAAHRGTGSLSKWAPENTIAAYNIAWNMGADAFETDVRNTKDGALVIQHDESLLRMTGCTKKVSDLTLAEIEKIKVKSYPGVAAQEIPTFDEVLDFAKDKMLVYVDVKTTDIAQVVEVIEDKDMINSAFLYITSPAEGYAARTINPDVALMPNVASIESVDEFIEALSPIVMFDVSFNNATPELIDYIHLQGIKVGMDSVGVNDIKGKAGWNSILGLGVDLIQTDFIDLLYPIVHA
jgi:glycerophosphoryl diester phosphodiesterase